MVCWASNTPAVYVTKARQMCSSCSSSSRWCLQFCSLNTSCTHLFEIHKQCEYIQIYLWFLFPKITDEPLTGTEGFKLNTWPWLAVKLVMVLQFMLVRACVKRVSTEKLSAFSSNRSPLVSNCTSLWAAQPSEHSRILTFPAAFAEDTEKKSSDTWCTQTNVCS